MYIIFSLICICIRFSYATLIIGLVQLCPWSVLGVELTGLGFDIGEWHLGHGHGTCGLVNIPGYSSP